LKDLFRRFFCFGATSQIALFLHALHHRLRDDLRKVIKAIISLDVSLNIDLKRLFLSPQQQSYTRRFATLIYSRRSSQPEVIPNLYNIRVRTSGDAPEKKSVLRRRKEKTQSSKGSMPWDCCAMLRSIPSKRSSARVLMLWRRW